VIAMVSSIPNAIDTCACECGFVVTDSATGAGFFWCICGENKSCTCGCDHCHEYRANPHDVECRYFTASPATSQHPTGRDAQP
jgi:hypothetical protein